MLWIAHAMNLLHCQWVKRHGFNPPSTWLYASDLILLTSWFFISKTTGDNICPNVSSSEFSEITSKALCKSTMVILRFGLSIKCVWNSCGVFVVELRTWSPLLLPQVWGTKVKTDHDDTLRGQLRPQPPENARLSLLRFWRKAKDTHVPFDSISY